MIKIVLTGFALCSLLSAQGIVIKKGEKIQKIKPLNEKEINKVGTKLSTRAGWTVDDSKSEKKKILRGNTQQNPDLECH